MVISEEKIQAVQKMINKEKRSTDNVKAKAPKSSQSHVPIYLFTADQLRIWNPEPPLSNATPPAGSNGTRKPGSSKAPAVPIPQTVSIGITVAGRGAGAMKLKYPRVRHYHDQMLCISQCDF